MRTRKRSTGQGFCAKWFLVLALIRVWSDPPYVAALSPGFVNQQRCLFVPAAKSPTKHPPLVLIPGMAQSIEVWEHHIPQLSQHRNVLVIEPTGLGRPDPLETTTAQQIWQNVSLPAQAERLVETVQAVSSSSSFSCETTFERFDLVGFSLGGRIALATACLYSSLVGKMHLTGVSLQRSDEGYLKILSWKDHLRQRGSTAAQAAEQLRAFSWSAILSTYSPAFLRRQTEQRLLGWVESICHRHTVDGLGALMEQTHVEGEEQAWSVQGMARHLSSDSSLNGRLLVGEFDVMAPVQQVEALAKTLSWESPTIVPGSGHAVPMEEPRLWREYVLAFLDERGKT